MDIRTNINSWHLSLTISALLLVFLLIGVAALYPFKETLDVDAEVTTLPEPQPLFSSEEGLLTGPRPASGVIVRRGEPVAIIAFPSLIAELKAIDAFIIESMASISVMRPAKTVPSASSPQVQDAIVRVATSTTAYNSALRRYLAQPRSRSLVQRASLDRQIVRMQAQIDEKVDQIGRIREINDRSQALSEKGWVSKIQLIELQNQLSAAQIDLSKVRNELDALVAQRAETSLADRMAEVERDDQFDVAAERLGNDLNHLRQTIDGLRAKLTLSCPYDARLAAVGISPAGSSIPANEPIAICLPLKGRPAVKLLIDQDFISFLEEGMSVQAEFENFSSSTKTQVKLTVEHISAAPNAGQFAVILSDAEGKLNSREYYFGRRVNVKLRGPPISILKWLF